MKFSLILAAALSSTALGQLHSKMEAKGKVYYGNILDANTLSNSQATTILRDEFGAITAENSMKWDAIEPSQGQFNFQGADNVANWATENGKLIRGHTLVWHSQLPGWVDQINDPNQLTSVIQNHIQELAGRYAGKVYAWDVVNEVFEEDGSFRNSVFYRVLGEEFIDLAFRTAREVDPNAKLYINDYNLDGPGAKIDAMIALIGRLQERGVPIDGVGSQAHLIVGQVGGVATQLERLAATGLDVAITELDIRIQNPVDQSKLQQQQQDYQTVTQACLNIPKCVGISIWGVSDQHSWVDTTFPEYDAPLLWDDNFQKKAAYQGVDAALS